MKKTQTLENWQSDFLSHLSNLDSEFANQIVPIGKMTPEECCFVYKRGYRARLIETLGDTFEATWWVLGDEDFFKLAQEFVDHIPSRSFDLSDYGAEFAAYLEQHSVSKEIPFVTTLARFEWNFKNLFHSQSIVPNIEALVKSLSENDSARLQLHGSCRIWNAPHSVYEIWKRRGEDITQVHEISWDSEQILLLYKYDQKVHVKEITRVQQEFLKAFENGSSLAAAAESLLKHSGELDPSIIQRFFAEFGPLGILHVPQDSRS